VQGTRQRLLYRDGVLAASQITQFDFTGSGSVILGAGTTTGGLLFDGGLGLKLNCLQNRATAH
jgi:hypothetical protein